MIYWTLKPLVRTVTKTLQTRKVHSIFLNEQTQPDKINKAADHINNPIEIGGNTLYSH